MRACESVSARQQTQPGWCAEPQGLPGEGEGAPSHSHTPPRARASGRGNSTAGVLARGAVPESAASPRRAQVPGPAARGGPRRSRRLRPAGRGDSGSAGSLSGLARPGRRGAPRARRAHGRLRGRPRPHRFPPDGVRLGAREPPARQLAFPARPSAAASRGALACLTSLPSGGKTSEISRTRGYPSGKAS
ncbi:methyl-CpG-binding domain protein 2-like [Hippopotamus amphibius kiboko]|uniref:methyl-CpG-binding domain protein 2-like n=1 Tax=Hippopotamus amphibius kiboko TaxID=575201 RepID=UPI0025930CC9|nr:methyl-CpG-binding domain protein 2-like [Hippopotamus amphibius kiboko]